MKQWVKITRLDNGYLVEYPECVESYPGLGIERTDFVSGVVFEDKEDELGDRESLQAALYTIIDQVGLPNGRYDAKRVRVIIEPGDKYSDIKED